MAKAYHHGDLKKTAIEKTVEIIQQKGEADFTLREVAQSLKVSHTAVYRHFSSKQDLLSHIAEEGFSNLCSAFAKELAGARTPKLKLEALGRAYIEFALHHSGHYRSMFHQELRCAKEQRPELETAGMAALSHLVEILAVGMKADVFKKDDPLTTARSVWSSLHGFSVLLIDGQFQSLKSKTKISEGIRQHLAFVTKALSK